MKKIQLNHWPWHPRYVTGEPGTKVQVPWPCQQQTRTKLPSQDKPERVDGSTTTSWNHAPLSAPGFLDWMCRVSMTTRLKRSLGSGEDSAEVTVSFQRDRGPFTSFLFWDHQLPKCQLSSSSSDLWLKLWPIFYLQQRRLTHHLLFLHTGSYFYLRNSFY